MGEGHFRKPGVPGGISRDPGFQEDTVRASVVFFESTVIPNTRRESTKVDPAVYDKHLSHCSDGLGDSGIITREGEKLVLSGERLEITR